MKTLILRHSRRVHGKLAGTLLLLLLLPAVAAAAPGWMGLGVGEVSSERVGALKLKEERGVEILKVMPDSPAAQAGLKERDVVLEYNGVRVDGVEQFQRMVRETPAGRTVRLLISRDGATQTVTMNLAERFRFGEKEFEFRMPKMEIPEVHVDVPDLFAQHSRLGIDGESLTKQLGEYFGAPNGEGVLVRSVDRDSPAEKAGIKAGDVVIKLDGERVTGMRDLRNLLREKSRKGSVPVALIRNRREMTVTVSLERRESRDRIKDRIIEKIISSSVGERL